MSTSAFMRDDRLQQNLRDATKKITEYKSLIERYDCTRSRDFVTTEKNLLLKSLEKSFVC